MKLHFKLRSVLILFTGLIALLFTLYLSIDLYQQSYREMLGNVTASATKENRLYGENLQQYLNSLENLAVRIRIDPAFKSSLSLKNSADPWDRHLSSTHMSSILESASYSHNDIVGILLMTDSPYFPYTKNFGFYNLNALKGTPFYDSLSHSPHSGYTCTEKNSLFPDNYHQHLFSYYEKISTSDESLAYLYIAVDPQVFSTILRPQSDNGTLFYLMDGFQAVYPSADAFSQTLASASPLQTGDVISYNGNNYLYVSTLLANHWNFISLVPMQNVENSAYAIVRSVIIKNICIFVLIILATILVIHIITRELNRLMQKMEVLGIEDYTFQQFSRIDEVKTLQQKFNEINVQLHSLMDKIKEDQAQIGKTQLEVLQAQINPHFLYNTLDAINWMAISSGNDEISSMVSNLAAMFRLGLNNGQEMTTLQKELTHLETYLSIQKYRYNDRFTFSKEIDQTLLSCETLNVILQPIVENSLLHGLRDPQDTIEISLQMKPCGGGIEILIADNGQGCNADFMNDYLASAQKTTKGYGIKNIHQRIQLHYGKEYGIRYLPSDIGTRVSIRIPRRTPAPEQALVTER